MLSIPDFDHVPYTVRKWKNRRGRIIPFEYAVKVKEGDVFGIGMVRTDGKAGVFVTVNGRIPLLPGQGAGDAKPGSMDLEMGTPTGEVWDAVVELPEVAEGIEDRLYPAIGSRGASQLLTNFVGPFLWDGGAFASRAMAGVEEAWLIQRDDVDPPPSY
jgi:hypothetical protein